MPRAVRFCGQSVEADRERPPRRRVLRLLGCGALRQGDINRAAATPVRSGRLEIAAPLAGCCERSLAMCGDRSVARGIAFEGLQLSTPRSPIKNLLV
jgi:hypothetical protein